jgi:peptide deformylase
MKLPLRYFGHSALRIKASSIQIITPDIIQLAADMIETMVSTNAVGIAGPQVGRLLRIFIMRDETITPHGDYVFGPPEVIINPVLSLADKESTNMVEGCLSIPGIHLPVTRPQKIHISYQNLKGETREEDLEGFRARVAMHENDHLNGVLFIDRLDSSERKRIEPYLRAIKQKYN